MIRVLVLVFLPVYFLSCSSQPVQIKIDSIKKIGTVPYDTLIQHDTVIAKIPNNDTIVIDQRCAVFYNPDSVQIEKRKKSLGEETFYIGADDYMNLMHTANEYLESQKLKIVDVLDKKYIVFKTQERIVGVIKTDTLSELWDLYLFDPAKGYMKADPSIIEDDYNHFLK